MKKDIKFEQAIESLDIAVSKLEGGELSLDESIKVFIFSFFSDIFSIFLL